jgi:hypothetical protein
MEKKREVYEKFWKAEWKLGREKQEPKLEICFLEL